MAVAAWHSELNRQPTPEGLAKCSTDKCTFWRECKHHVVLLSAEAANKEPVGRQRAQPAWRRCRFCSKSSKQPDRGQPSQVAKHALDLLEHLASAHGSLPVYTESRAVQGGRCGAMDFGLAVRRLNNSSSSSNQPLIIWVEVDGEQHLKRAMHETSAADQQVTDRTREQLAVQQGLRLVRLYEHDSHAWHSKLLEAINIAQQHPTCAFVLYTKSYHLKDVKQGGSDK